MPGIPTYGSDGSRLRDRPLARALYLESQQLVALHRNRKGIVLCARFYGDTSAARVKPGTHYSYRRGVRWALCPMPYIPVEQAASLTNGELAAAVHCERRKAFQAVPFSCLRSTADLSAKTTRPAHATR
jgi:hypothetical protein